ncbi:MAG: YciI family protein [Bacteroidota bacterium]
MEKFILIVRENLKEIGQFTTEDRFARSPDMMPWVNALIESGKYIMGAPFLISGGYVTQNETFNKGEFLDSTTGLSGFDIILAENIEEAVAVAQACPMVKSGFAIREVRQLVNMD